MRPAPWFHDSGTKAPGGVGLYAKIAALIEVILWRHASFCPPGYWLIQMQAPAELPIPIGLPYVSTALAVVDDFGTLVEVEP